MTSEHIRLLRRPLPPKKTHPLFKPLKRTAVPAESISLRVHSDTDNVWSLRDYHLWALDLAPTSLTFLSQAPSITSPQAISFFPSQPHRTFQKWPIMDLLKDDPRFAMPAPCFFLGDFLKSVEPSQPGKKVVLSRINYKKLMELFLVKLHHCHQKEVANQILSCEDLPEIKPRIPQRQITCELAVLVQTDLHAPKMRVWHCGDERLSHSDRKSVELWTPPKKQATHTPRPVNEVILNSAPAKFFQGSRRSCSPFQSADECSSIAPTQLAVLECIKQHKTALNLKAHFITVLPDLSLLAPSLLYLNLSFNDFTIFPVEVCELTRLEILKLRDNPIKEIPAKIEKLIYLKTLVFSFCSLTALPPQLYYLPFLQDLDVSHNLISTLSNDIKNLRSLRYLNVEGNQLVALPAGLLQVPLSQLKLSGNYTHPLLWISHNMPLSLSHTATQVLACTLPEQQYTSLPSVARLALSRAGVCDCCRGPLYGPGLKLIRPVCGIFGQLCIPILFLSCSPSCSSSFKPTATQPH